MRVQSRLPLLIGVLSALLSGCEISIVMPSMAGPAPAGPGLETIIAGTAAAAQTQTAEMMSPTPSSTWTPLPSRTPSLTPTSTPTFIFILGGLRTPVIYETPIVVSTSSGSGTIIGDKLDGCTLLTQSPADGRHYAAKASFTVSWKVQNTGSRWDRDTVDFAYDSGTRMYTKQVYRLPVDIPRGEYVTFNVPMTAPKSSGTYTTVWALRRGQVAYPNPGDDRFCHVSLKIRVP